MLWGKKTSIFICFFHIQLFSFSFIVTQLTCTLYKFKVYSMAYIHCEIITTISLANTCPPHTVPKEKLNRLLILEFMLIWLGRGLCVLLAVAVADSLQTPWVPCRAPRWTLGPLSTHQGRCCDLWSLLVVVTWGSDTLYDLWLSLSLAGFVLLDLALTITSVSPLVDSPPLGV